MEAIFTRGPMTVSVNAEPEDWRFYKSGVYVNKACSPKLKKLDHAVIVSGLVTLLDLSRSPLHSSACEAQLKKLNHAVIVSDLPPHLISQEWMGSHAPIEPSPQPAASCLCWLHVCKTCCPASDVPTRAFA